MLNILLVEDNIELRQLMKIHLQRARYNIFEADDGLAALDLMQHQHIHLLIVDIMMPRMNGFDLICALRETNITVPVIIVTAKDAMDDKTCGFRSGADDYLTKPINMEELLLRVEALLRRAELTNHNRQEIAGTIMNEEKLSVSWDNSTILLRQKEFQLLHLLLSYQGRIFTRQILMDEIWGYDSETDPRTVDVHIKRLREKLSANPYFTIETVRGLGYKIMLLQNNSADSSATE